MIAVGEPLPPFEIARVDSESMRIWAGLLRDPNPIHLDRIAVHAAGLGDRLINQGPANLAYILNMLGRAFPGWRVKRTNIRFMANVYEGDQVIAGGSMTASEADIVTCDVWLTVEGRGHALSGTAILARP